MLYNKDFVNEYPEGNDYESLKDYMRNNKILILL